MREFGIAFSEGLRKGLRPFTRYIPGKEMLVECFNLMPHQDGLLPHDTLVPLGITTIQAEYICLKDQNDVTWCWMAGRGLDTIVFSGIPSIANSGFDPVSITPVVVPSWLQVDALDTPATQLYLYPHFVDGYPFVNTVPPPLGVGYDILGGLTMKSLSGRRHRLTGLSSLDFYWQEVP